MPLIDVSDLLVDPDFCEPVTIYRRVQSVDTHGRSIISETSQTILAVVTAASANTLNRAPEGTRIEGAITVHSITPLAVATGSRDADELVWKGNRYVVTMLGDYSHYGQGFTVATCTLKPLSPA